MIYNCKCVGEKTITSKKKGKEYILLWVVLYDENLEFSDCIKLFSNKSLKGVGLGVSFTAKKGFNKESRETFLYDINIPDIALPI